MADATTIECVVCEEERDCINSGNGFICQECFLKEKMKTKEIVNCPMHKTKNGDYFPTPRCPDCRPYQFKMTQVTCKYCSSSTKPHICKYCGAEITKEYANQWLKWQEENEPN